MTGLKSNRCKKFDLWEAVVRTLAQYTRSVPATQQLEFS